MTDKMVDVGGRRRPVTPTSAADIVGHQADVGHRHFFSSSPTLTPTSSADVGVSVGKLDRQCRRPTLADTQADTQSVTLVDGPTWSNGWAATSVHLDMIAE